jgi:alanine racemase
VSDGSPIDRRLAAAGLPGLPRTAWLEIDLDVLAANLATIRASVAPGARIEPVVKADAYGHGAVPVATALVGAGADGLCVATIDEALELRDAGIEAPILVLFPVPPETAPEAAERNVAVTAGDRGLLERTIDVLERRPSGPPLRVGIEVETGLGRGGFTATELDDVLARIAASDALVVTSAWSHLTAAEDEVRSAAQLARFEEAIHGSSSGTGAGAMSRHLAASGAILSGSVPALDAVRPGLVLYGILPEETPVPARLGSLATRVRPILSLHACPVRVADLPTGTGIGYGPAYTTTRPSRIATLPIGYGDGYARTMSGRVDALVRGWRAPIRGTIAMDAVMVDVTDVPGEPITVDDEFVLLGRSGDEAIDVFELARARTTISWEVVASMAARLPRVYTRDSFPVGVRTLTARRGPWRTSSSGTGTSAISRSTPS